MEAFLGGVLIFCLRVRDDDFLRQRHPFGHRLVLGETLEYCTGRLRKLDPSSQVESLTRRSLRVSVTGSAT